LPSTSVTCCSSETAFNVMPAASAKVCDSAQQGTCGAQTTKFTPSAFASSKDDTSEGLSASTMPPSLFEANSPPLRGSKTSASTALCILDSSAEAKTSAGTPASRFSTSVEEPAELKSNVM